MNCDQSVPVAGCCRTWGLALITQMLLGSVSAFAQDRVILQQPGGSRFPISGIVDDYTGREVTVIVRAGEQSRRYPRQDVIEVQTAYTAHHEKGRQWLAKGDVARAKPELTQALKEEDRAWVRRLILADLVRCALWNGDYLAAAPNFLAIVESDPETMHFGLAPLAWTDQSSDAKVIFEARAWITEKSLVAQLIGASHLLFDRESNDQAETVLRRLARESNIRLQRLAQMQLWRVRSVSGTATPSELLRWESAIDDLPEELRAGGYYVLGQTFRRQQQPERAAATLLWLPLVYDSDRHLAARACLEAAEMVESFGDRAQATNLYSEVVFRFPDTPVAGKAEEKWKMLKGETGQSGNGQPANRKDSDQ
ncbi:MAG: hypothetical protein WCJ09_04075 [Planctomycetota bacterium]